MLQLKRVDFDAVTRESHKIQHDVTFPSRLNFAGDMCRLVGIVRHEGKHFAGGHWTANMLSDGNWWRVDGMRNVWLQVSEKMALQPDNVGMLLYQRERDATVPVGPCMYGCVIGWMSDGHSMAI